MVRQSVGDTSRMFTIRADGSGEEEFRLPAPCKPDDRGCTILRVFPSVSGRSLVMALEHLFWYDVATGDLTHITRVDDRLTDTRAELRFVVTTRSTDDGSTLTVADRKTGATIEMPFSASTPFVAQVPDGVLVVDQRGPTVIVNMVTGNVVTLDDGLLVAPDQISADRELLAAFDIRGDETDLVIVDIDDPSSPSPWPPIEFDNFAFDWAGDQLLTVSDQDGTVRLVDEFDSVALQRLWPDEILSGRVTVDPTGMYALVNVDNRTEMLWYRVDIVAGRADEVVELRGLEPSDINVHADQGLMWATDEVDDDRKYTRLVAAPIAPGQIVEVLAAELPTSAVVWALGGHHVFVRTLAAQETWWVVDLVDGARSAAAGGTDPRLSADQSTLALNTRLGLESQVILVPLDNPTAAMPLIAGAAIDWMER